jgi:heme exporter protein D
MSEFFAMGGYAFYVWTAYGVFAIVMIWSYLAPVLRRRQFEQTYRAQQAMLARRKKTDDTDS